MCTSLHSKNTPDTLDTLETLDTLDTHYALDTLDTLDTLIMRLPVIFMTASRGPTPSQIPSPVKGLVIFLHKPFSAFIRKWCQN